MTEHPPEREEPTTGDLLADLRATTERDQRVRENRLEALLNKERT